MKATLLLFDKKQQAFYKQYFEVENSGEALNAVVQLQTDRRFRLRWNNAAFFWLITADGAAAGSSSSVVGQQNPAFIIVCTDYELTATEINVALKMRHCDSRNELAVALNMSRGTVNTHLPNIFDKLKVKSYTQAIRKLEKEARTKYHSTE